MVAGGGNGRPVGDGGSDDATTRPVRASTYHFHVAEPVPTDLLDTLFVGVRAADPDRDGAFLVGDVRDQEQLHGILARFALLGLTVLDVRQVVPRDADGT